MSSFTDKLLEHLYPPKEKMHDFFFNNPEMINEMINSAGGSSGIKSMESIPSLKNLILNIFKNTEKKSINPIFNEETKMVKNQNMINKKPINSPRIPEGYIGEGNGFIYDPLLEMHLEPDYVKDIISQRREGINNLMRKLDDPKWFEKYTNPTGEKERMINQMNKNKDEISHYIDLLNGGSGFLTFLR